MYDYEYCSDMLKLHEFLKDANNKGYEIISMTQRYGYTILYKKKVK